MAGPFKLRSGNGPLKFKMMGASSPMRDHETDADGKVIEHEETEETKKERRKRHKQEKKNLKLKQKIEKIEKKIVKPDVKEEKIEEKKEVVEEPSGAITRNYSEKEMEEKYGESYDTND